MSRPSPSTRNGVELVLDLPPLPRTREGSPAGEVRSTATKPVVMNAAGVSRVLRAQENLPLLLRKAPAHGPAPPAPCARDERPQRRRPPSPGGVRTQVGSQDARARCATQPNSSTPPASRNATEAGSAERTQTRSSSVPAPPARSAYRRGAGPPKLTPAEEVRSLERITILDPLPQLRPYAPSWPSTGSKGGSPCPIAELHDLPCPRGPAPPGQPRRHPPPGAAHQLLREEEHGALQPAPSPLGMVIPRDVERSSHWAPPGGPGHSLSWRVTLPPPPDGRPAPLQDTRPQGWERPGPMEGRRR